MLHDDRHIMSGTWRSHAANRALSSYREVRRSAGQARAWLSMWHEATRLRRFANRHADQTRCFLIGNGPSLRHEDLAPLGGEIVFVTNSFVLHPQYEQVAPTYYCVADQSFFTKTLDAEVAAAFRQKSRGVISFLPYTSKTAIQSMRLAARDRTFYVRAVNGGVWRTGTMNLDPTLGVYSGRTVIIDFCLPLVFYMGFREVYLLGCDTDYGLDRAPDYSQAYFFDLKPDRPRLDAVAHQTSWYAEVIQSYQVAKRLFEADGRRIYNATCGGRLEVFERVALGDVLGRSA